MTENLTFTLGGLILVSGMAWKLSRDITTLQVEIVNLTRRFDLLERILTARFGTIGTRSKDHGDE